MKSLETVNISQYGFSVLQIETTSICNMRCRFCVFPTRNDKGKVLPEDVILSIIDSLCIDDRFEYVCFSHFNEPLLDNRIYDFVKYTKNKKLPVLIITNGLLFDSKDIIHRLISSGPDYIKVSLQTLNANNFCSARGVNNSFSKYKDGIFRFLKVALGSTSKVTVDVACNFLSGSKKMKTTLFGLERGDPSVYDTIDDLRGDIKSFLKELYNFDSCFISNNTDIDSYLDEVRSNYLQQSGFNVAENISIKIKPFIFGKKLTEFFPIKNGIGCLNRILGILANGHVVPCCLAYDDILTMGNVKEEPLRKILEKKNSWLNSIRNGIDLQLVCRRCLGAPTKRGAIVQQLKKIIFK